MKLDPNQTVAGVPIRRIRAFLRKVHERRWPADAVEAAFPARGAEILDGLIEEGYVIPTSEPGLYKTTLKGDTLVEATGPSVAPRRKCGP
jgi:hypothetical protein